ncbi:MAG: CoA-binding protein [Chloroflexi bacterium]|nr:CoA-binding protein [Chloroflexota bacterium]
MISDNIAQMERIFHPRSIAIAGASNREGNLGRRFVTALQSRGFEPLYVINPNASEVFGLKSYASLQDIPNDVDVVIVSTAPGSVRQIITDCAEKGVAGAIIFSAGFGEVGEEGKKKEAELVEIAHRGGVRLIGPNCTGVYSPSARVATTTTLPVESGSVALLSHSGSFAESFSILAGTKGIRFSKVVSCGNQCDLNAADFLEYFGQDEETKLIIGYIEGMKDGRRFFEIARRVAPKKPVIIWKGGLTAAGARMAASHTGALAGSSDIWRALCRQTGIITVDSVKELLDLVLTFYYLPLPQGKRVGIISGPGGFAVTTSDACAKYGLELPEFLPETQQLLREVIPPVGGSFRNPADVSIKSTIQPELFRKSIEIIAQAANIDMIYVIRGMPEKTFFDNMLEAGRNTDKPLGLFIFRQEVISEDYIPLLKAGIAMYTDSAMGVLALSRFARYAEFVRNNYRI